MEELCEALSRTRAAVQWTCTAHPAHLDRDVLAEMRRAGCAGVDIGMESADPGMLVRIGKGVTSSPMYLIANLAISATVGGALLVPAKVDIDYVHVWQRP